MTTSRRRRPESHGVALMVTLTVTLPLVVMLPLMVGAAHAAEPGDPEKAFTVSDPRIVESSGLTWVDIGAERFIVTVNDSGDSGQVFTLDSQGNTAGVSTFSPSPRDVEALAPAGEDHVWVADIGDNSRARGSVVLTRMPVGPGDRVAQAPTRRELVYPDRARDAEALLAHPQTGQLFIVTKSVTGGRIFEVPAAPGGNTPVTLVDVGQAPLLITDGAFWPGGDFVVLRDYARAHLLTFPEWDLVGSFVLPAQPQGEGLTVLPEGEILLSTEGSERDVVQVRLPEDLQAVVDEKAQGGEETPDDEEESWWVTRCGETLWRCWAR